MLTISNHNVYTPMQASNKPDQAVKFLDGYEHTVPNQHMFCLAFGEPLDVKLPYQEVINRVNEKGGLTVICHPNLKHDDYCPIEVLLSLEGYSGIEIVNAGTYRREGSIIATREWDVILSARKKVWSFGTDDYHWQADAGRGWNMILARSNDPDECVDSIRTGAHYVSTGIRLQRLEVIGDKLFCEAKRMPETFVKEYFYRFFGKDGILLKEEFGESAFCPMPEHGYIRAQVINEEGSMLWTQPVYEQNWFHE